MSSINFSEILTIAIIVLIVFGPDRLPDLARKAGKFVARARSMIRDTEAELRSQYGESFDAIDEARKEIGAARRDITSTARRAERELRGAARDIEKGVNEPVRDPNRRPAVSEGPDTEPTRETAARAALDAAAAPVEPITFAPDASGANDATPPDLQATAPDDDTASEAT
ncbi:MAG: hypothetical protein HKN07_15255 [Acidimicrobiia bacterium]|nr:twin-arginine translocase TatA/TatE family subunit [Acidimicrobiia bacterium]NNF65599.1 hypothetical protein [Acidimicrobiia bacterium]